MRKLLPGAGVNDRRGFAPLSHDARIELSTSADPVWADEVLSRERALRAAILIDAVRCLIGVPGGRDRRARRAAARWVLSRDTRFAFSFHNVCESLGFEPARVRRLLLASCLDADAATELVLGPRGRAAVRRPRRDRERYVMLKGGLQR